jgi:hypothetical protein
MLYSSGLAKRFLTLILHIHLPLDSYLSSAPHRVTVHATTQTRDQAHAKILEFVQRFYQLT